MYMAEEECSVIAVYVLLARTGSRGNYFDLTGVGYFLKPVGLGRQKHVSR
jgi:hypothetical protein